MRTAGAAAVRLVTAISILLLVACSVAPAPRPTAESISRITPIAHPAGWYAALEWLPNGTIIVVFQAPSEQADPDTEQGWYSTGSRICHGVAAMDRSGPLPTDLTLMAEGQSIKLSTTMASVGQGDCPGAPRANWPTYSRDGSELAIGASPGGSGFGGQARLDLPWTINLIAARVRARVRRTPW